MSTASSTPRPLVVGLDIALGTTGVAGAEWTDHIRTGDRRGEARLERIVEACAGFYRHADLVMIEGPSYGNAGQAGHDEMAAARWMVRCDLRRRRIPFAIVPPPNRTIYATGKARHKDPATDRWLTARQVKGLVLTAVQDHYGIECTGVAKYDEADAFVLAAMGLHWLGWPLAEVPETHSRALDGCAWPEPVPLTA